MPSRKYQRATQAEIKIAMSSHELTDLENQPNFFFSFSLFTFPIYISSKHHSPSLPSHDVSWNPLSFSGAHYLSPPPNFPSNTLSEPDDSIHQQPDEPMSDRELLIRLICGVSTLSPHLVSLRRNFTILTTLSKPRRNLSGFSKSSIV